MNAERKPSEQDLETRAARYAALGDPVRLRVVDLLTLGDLSPTELQARLGIPSNLMAHHLGVLEGAGLVARSRSEADRRRSYVRLAEGALRDLAPSPRAAARRVVFVCTGNSARSPLAAALWEATSDVPVVSAGTHPAVAVDAGAVRVARRRGLDVSGARPRHIDDVLRADDLVVTVCDAAHEELGGRGDVHWSVPDPVRIGTASAFDRAADELAARVEALAASVAAAS